MTLTVGTAPFGNRPSGVFNREMPERRGLIYFEDFLPRVRARFAGETVVDSTRVKLLHEHGRLPVFYFPRDDVRTDLLEPTDHETHCPWKGDASYWSVRVGDRVAENAVWGYPEPVEGAPPIADHVACYWDPMDEWLQEDEQLIVHPRDPYHRVEVLDTSRQVKVSVAGEVVAESARVRVLYETTLPPRWYLPREDVRTEVLEPSDARTGCAYKGFASYFHVRIADTFEDDLVWTYPEPRVEAQRVEGYLCFFNERVDLEIDGELQKRPITAWSRGRGVATADSDLLP
ncbi:MAG: DUF427 domain-containing protein [Actinomycetota bacterium]|nr:DUF427 domain-containing protein [Actinomycetota bacterium]